MLSGQGATFQVNLDDIDEKEIINNYESTDFLNYSNMDCLGDDDIYDDSQPFEILSEKMTNVIESGKIKKRILREGYGLVVPDLAEVTINYNAYIEFNPDPFDSTYIRKKPFKFRLNSGQTLPGLDFAISTMKINEKSQFLIAAEFAYGKFGCLDRIPPDSDVLFEVELKNICNSGPAVTYTSLDEETRKTFDEIRKYALALCDKGNELYSRKAYKKAIKEYNVAIAKLLKCQLADYNEQEKQAKLLLRLYTNLAVTNMQIKEPRKVCTACNEIYRMTKGTSLKVPAKVFFNNAKSLIQLGDFYLAEKRLLQAQKLEPTNAEISKEIKYLEETKKIHLKRETELAKAMLKFKIDEKNTKLPEQPTDQFKQSIKETCKELKENSVCEKYKLPSKLSNTEIKFIESEVKNYNLTFLQDFKSNEQNYICKILKKNSS